MWIAIFIVLGLIIYPIVSFIVDSVSNKIKEDKRKEFYSEEELNYVTTYNNDNITKNDIMFFFNSQLKFYKKRYYIIYFKVYNAKEEQNHAWSIKTTKETYGWGIVYNIIFHFSNGWVHLNFSSSDFTTNGESSNRYYYSGFDLGSGEIEKTLDVCREEARIKWKINGIEPEENSPFNYIPLTDNNSSSSNTNRSKKASSEDTAQFELLSFYRNLLCLKLRFSYDELKKSYREAVGKYHPDRYSSSSPRDRENAEMLMKQVNEAYERLKEVAE